MKVMTFNLKDDGLKLFSNWKKRLYGFVELIKKENPDIIGTQEMTNKARKLLKKLLVDNNLEYNIYGESRKRNNRLFDEYNSVLIKKYIKTLNSITYSLSETPLIPKTKFKNDKFPRIMTFIETEKFYLYNTHLTNKIDKNKFLQLECITKLLKKDKPIIITGDFNLGISRINNFCKKNSLIDTTKSIKNTFYSKKHKYHLDHILVSKNIKYKKPIKYTNKYKNVYLSDHTPITIEIKNLI